MVWVWGGVERIVFLFMIVVAQILVTLAIIFIYEWIKIINMF